MEMIISGIYALQFGLIPNLYIQKEKAMNANVLSDIKFY